MYYLNYLIYTVFTSFANKWSQPGVNASLYRREKILRKTTRSMKGLSPTITDRPQ